MRKIFRKFSILAACSLLAASAASMAACGYQFTPLSEGPSASDAVTSQGGFVVQKGDYVYFINGVETYTSDNTYGTPVKGALMRAKMSDIKAGINEAETVIPSLMVAADYTSGIYIYGERIYYATPNNMGNTAGQVDNTYLDFRSTALDGSDMQFYFRIADNAALYRFVEVDGTVYVVYEEDDNLISYNTAAGTSVTLAESTTAYTVNSKDVTDPYIYYTMDVTDRQDSANPQAYEYNQIYRVRADATESPYEYTWDQEYLDEENDGEAPYVNLGEIVLDGISVNDDETQFNHDVTEDNRSIWRYTYTLQSYTNDGIYFVRTAVPTSGSSVGTSGELYYLSVEDLESDSFDSVTGNSVYSTNATDGWLEVVASAADTSNANTSAYFYIEEDGNVKHHYLYVNSDGEIRRVDVINDGLGTKAENGRNGDTSLRIATGASGAVLTGLDSTSSGTYDYVYYTCTTDNGLSIERAVYNGEPEYYNTLTPAGEDYSAYRPVRVLEAEHASGWYNYEVVDGVVFYINAETFSSTSYTYVWTINLNGEDGLMDNVEVEAFNERYETVVGEDGYLETLTEEGNSKLSSAIRYFFYTGESDQVFENIEEAESFGKRNTYLYSEEEQAAFRAFVDGTSEDAIAFFGENYLDTVSLGTYANLLGVMTEDDTDLLADYWQNYLERYTEETAEEAGLPGWAWALIGVAIAVVVLGAGLAVVLVILHKRKKDAQEKPELMEVDTTDDEDVDVYAMNDSTPAVPATVAEPDEAAEEPAEESEAPAEEAEEPAETEAPAETPAEQSPETPSEE
ncbi:MAG TPA: hypothetical protein H9812_04190 [Candidatus Gallimonas intestinigallinarum]|uniref:Uncharacterized protein n=1 Tax=Candidatus Gallimonas intestinigallinarum TaxID=2838604 RepID=A0A9D2IV61_9FIRM|nr:hypothetical protein [Candidatus Gallimonas intestinigallinarum]